MLEDDAIVAFENPEIFSAYRSVEGPWHSTMEVQTWWLRGSYTGFRENCAVDYASGFRLEFRAEGALKPVWFRLVRVTRTDSATIDRVTSGSQSLEKRNDDMDENDNHIAHGAIEARIANARKCGAGGPRLAIRQGHRVKHATSSESEVQL
jgi:hypothetical protein